MHGRGDRVQHRGLSCAVRADEAGDLAAFARERHPVDGADPAEAADEVLDDEHVVHSGAAVDLATCEDPAGAASEAENADRELSSAPLPMAPELREGKRRRRSGKIPCGRQYMKMRVSSPMTTHSSESMRPG